MTILNPTLLRTFLAVRKHLSYTRAADEVYLSQPAVSRQIQQLERELGVPLFEQIGRTLHVTDAGSTLACEAEKLLADMERVAESVAAHRALDAGTLRIGAGTTPGFYLLPPIVGVFHRKYPGVEIDYVVEQSRGVEQKVLRNELDLGFIGGPPLSDYLLAETVAEDEIVCFASPSHPLADRRRINVKALGGETWIVRRPGSATRELFEAWLASAGGETGRTIELGCPEAVRSLVAAGVGIGYMSNLAIDADLRRKRLKQLAILGLKLRRRIYLIRHSDKHVSPLLKAFLDLLRSAIGRTNRSSSGD